MFGLGPFELAVIGVIAVVLFGGNLPEAARKFGQTYAQFRRSLDDVQSQFRDAQREVDRSIHAPASKTATVDDDDEPEVEPTAPKFKPPV